MQSGYALARLGFRNLYSSCGGVGIRSHDIKAVESDIYFIIRSHLPRALRVRVCNIVEVLTIIYIRNAVGPYFPRSPGMISIQASLSSYITSYATYSLQMGVLGA